MSHSPSENPMDSRDRAALSLSPASSSFPPSVGRGFSSSSSTEPPWGARAAPGPRRCPEHRARSRGRSPSVLRERPEGAGAAGRHRALPRDSFTLQGPLCFRSE